MGGLRLAGVTLLLGLATPVQAQAAHRWDPLVREASRRFAIPQAWISQVIEAESGGRASVGGRPVRSSAGAMGLMQVMPETWAETRNELGLGPDPDDPRDNILAGTFYLRAMYDRFGYPGLFAAYHSGPGRYAQFLAGRASLPPQTLVYLDRVTRRSGHGDPVRPRPASIFPVEGSPGRFSGRAGDAAIAARTDALFVPLGHSEDRPNN